MNLAEGTFAGLAGPESDLFCKHLAGLPGHAVEIGCLDGYSTAVILACSALHLTSIDPFIPDSMEASLIGKKERLLENVKPWADRFTLIEGYSQEVVLNWRQLLDFLFVDGDHTYLAVERDYSQWAPLLRKGGLLAMHDSRMGRPGGANFHPGPSQVAAERVYGNPSMWEIVGEAFSLTLARKLL
jgi:hypothetical protein